MGKKNLRYFVLKLLSKANLKTLEIYSGRIRREISKSRLLKKPKVELFDILDLSCPNMYQEKHISK